MKTLILLIFAACAVAFLNGCDNTQILYPIARDNNCLDWAMANKRQDEWMIYGRYTLAPIGEAHVWLISADGNCRDSIHKAGFICSDDQYKANMRIDLSDPETLELVMATRV